MATSQRERLLLLTGIVMIRLMAKSFVIHAPLSLTSSPLLSSRLREIRRPQAVQVAQRKTHSTRFRAQSPTTSSVLPNNLFYHNLTDTRRIFCISDLHTDHAANLEWLRQQSALDPTDLLIVAGDISHHLTTTFQTSLRLLRSHCRVLFVPGNHEAWLTAEDQQQQHGNGRPICTSLDKLEACYEMCRQEDVYVDPIWIPSSPTASTMNTTLVATGTSDFNPTTATTKGVWILPLESWYDGTLSFDESLCQGFAHWPWVDFAKCKWPLDQFPPANQQVGDPNNMGKIPVGLVEHFLRRNEERIWAPWQRTVAEQSELPTTGATPHPPRDCALITVSHFLPNQQCLPDWKTLSEPVFSNPNWLDHGAGETSAKFAKVAGSTHLGAQLEHYQPDLHIFGHSHRPKDIVLPLNTTTATRGGFHTSIRYLHHPLGKPREREWHMIDPNVTYRKVWDTTTSSSSPWAPRHPVIRYWEEQGGGVEALRERLARERQARRQRANRYKER